VSSAEHAVLAVALLCPAPCSPWRCCVPHRARRVAVLLSASFCRAATPGAPRPTPCPASAPRGQSRATPRLSNLGCCDELRLPIAVAVCLREYRRRLQALRGDETGSGGEARLDDDDDGVPGEDDETVLGAAPLDDAEVDSPALAFDRSSIQVLEEVTFCAQQTGGGRPVATDAGLGIQGALVYCPGTDRCACSGGFRSARLLLKHWDPAGGRLRIASAQKD
jgi:hypothetical protein